MPWSQTTAMHQRTRFIADHLRGVHSATELCAQYGISRKTGYKWIDRYHERGPTGLEAQSRRPLSSPNATAPHVVNALIQLRRRHPT
jgi:putative transposase